jgi:tRNA-dihydrouridine synthase B
MVFAPYTIRTVTVAPGLVLAPMSGVTASPFRRLIRELNPGAVGLLVSEFISIEGMTREGRRSLEMMRYRELERPFGIQIFGFDIERMRDAALMVQDAGADLVDINCGCPAPKVVKRGGGCELMRHPEHLATMLREVRRAVSIPLTLKMRAGWDSESRNAREIARIAEEEGVDALTVHGRTRTEMYRGLADWSLIREIAAERRIPVCGSGDVTDYRSATERYQGVAGLYIGRAALTNPFVFKEIIEQRPATLKKDPVQLLHVVQRYIELLLEDFPPVSCVGRVKQLVSQMCKGFPWAKDVCRASTLHEQLEILKRAAEAPEGVGTVQEYEGPIFAGRES